MGFRIPTHRTGNSGLDSYLAVLFVLGTCQPPHSVVERFRPEPRPDSTGDALYLYYSFSE